MTDYVPLVFSVASLNKKLLTLSAQLSDIIKNTKAEKSNLIL